MNEKLKELKEKEEQLTLLQSQIFKLEDEIQIDITISLAELRNISAMFTSQPLGDKCFNILQNIKS